MSKEKNDILNFCYAFSQLTISLFLERCEIQRSNFYTGKVSIYKLRKLKQEIEKEIKKLGVSIDEYNSNSL